MWSHVQLYSNNCRHNTLATHWAATVWATRSQWSQGVCKPWFEKLHFKSHSLIWSTWVNFEMKIGWSEQVLWYVCLHCESQAFPLFNYMAGDNITNRWLYVNRLNSLVWLVQVFGLCKQDWWWAWNHRCWWTGSASDNKAARYRSCEHSQQLKFNKNTLVHPTPRVSVKFTAFKEHQDYNFKFVPYIDRLHFVFHLFKFNPNWLKI